MSREGHPRGTGEEKDRERVRARRWISSLSEKPRTQRPRRLSDWINTGQVRKVHSLVDKVYSRKNLALAWEVVRRNGGAGGVDRVSLERFAANLEENLEQLHEELRTQRYEPQPLRRVFIPKAGKRGQLRPLGIPAVRDRVCQQALAQRLVPIFEPDFDNGSFGYRPGRSPHGAMRKIWREIEAGRVWVVDADLRDFFGSVDHMGLMQLVTRRIADGRVLTLIEQMLKAPVLERGRVEPTVRGTPQGGVISPLLANILLTPFDKEMRARGYRLTRYADDWVVTCTTRSEAERALATARRILKALGVTLHREKTRIVHVKHGFEFLGYVVRQGKRPLQLPQHRVKSGARPGALYAQPSERARRKFRDQIRYLTRRKRPVSTAQLIREINPVIRGWGMYYRRAHVRKLFNQFDRWIVRRVWSHRYRRWRNRGWKQYPMRRLRGELGLQSLVAMIPSLEHRRVRSS
jgi:group II intron reverse transcriptase/maturase